MTKEISDALMKDAELTKEEYAVARKDAADTASEKTGTETETLTEEEKHRRIEMNFYGTMVNFMLNLTQLIAALPERIAAAVRASGEETRNE